MANPTIYMYDNATGIDIPLQIDTYQVELLLGSTVSEIHKSILPCKLFCVFTPIADADFIVQSKEDEQILSDTIKFGKRNFKVITRESSIWYSDKASKNIIISDTVNIPQAELISILRLYLNEVSLRKIEAYKRQRQEIYSVINTRRNTILLKTPFIQEAKALCDKNPCCIIVDNKDTEIYKSAFGRKSIPYKQNNHVAKYKLRQKSDKDMFRINLR